MADFYKDKDCLADELARKNIDLGTDNYLLRLKSAHIILNALRDGYAHQDLFIKKVTGDEALAHYPNHEDDNTLRDIRTRVMELPTQLCRLGYIKFDYKDTTNLMIRTDKMQ